jgi:hypothetical protein
MTEFEALKFMKLFREEWDRNSKTENAKALDVAIKALEDIQKIRELGECYIIPKNSTWEVNGIDIHKAIKKQIPKKPYYVQYDGNPKIGNPHCSNCCGIISNGGTAKGMHCKWCGQKLDWETEF